jgi:hypothetical protein
MKDQIQNQIPTDAFLNPIEFSLWSFVKRDNALNTLLHMRI